MQAMRREIKKRRGLKQLLKDYGLIRSIDLGLQFVWTYLIEPLYRFEHADYGFTETFFYPRSVAFWGRYSAVVKEIEKMEKAGSTCILEVGSGGKGISRFVRKPEYAITLLDIRKDPFIGMKKRHNLIIGDGCKLPFKDRSFDVVLSADTVEHVPKDIRYRLLAELKRVCQRKIILTLPVESEDGVYRGKTYDIRFQDAHKRIFGREDLYTAEHISSDHPTIDEIEKQLPDSKMFGLANCDVWLQYMIFSARPVVGFLTGLIYYFFWKKRDNNPPYWGCIVSYTPPIAREIPPNRHLLPQTNNLRNDQTAQANLER